MNHIMPRHTLTPNATQLESVSANTMASESASTTTTGYDRLRQLNRFLPTDIQVALHKNIGRNERAALSSFLIGQDDSKVNSPYLPIGLQQEIKDNHREMTVKKWNTTLRKHTSVVYGDFATLFRKKGGLRAIYKMYQFLVMYPCPGDSLDQINRMLRNGKKMKKAFENIMKKEDMNYKIFIMNRYLNDTEAWMPLLRDHLSTPYRILLGRITNILDEFLTIYEKIYTKLISKHCAGHLEGIPDATIENFHPDDLVLIHSLDSDSYNLLHAKVLRVNRNTGRVVVRIPLPPGVRPQDLSTTIGLRPKNLTKIVPVAVCAAAPA